jgi:hypothetical protein
MTAIYQNQVNKTLYEIEFIVSESYEVKFIKIEYELDGLR